MFVLTEDQMISGVLPKHNSGYVLIKAKDAHEYEFRLTAPEDEALLLNAKRQASAPKSPQQKAKDTKKKLVVAKKGKSMKPGTKGKLVKKGKKGAGSKEASPSTKISLKALLSGRKGAGKKGKGQPAKVNPTKKSGKKGSATKGKSKKDSDSRPGTPTQSQGLQALLEAASQIDRLDANNPSTPASTSAAAKPSPSPAKVTRRSAAMAAAAAANAAVSSASSKQSVPAATVQSSGTFTSATVTSISSSAAPMIITTQPVLTAQGTSLPAGTTLLGPLPAGIQAAPQISMAVLQKLLGLSVLPPGNCSLVSFHFIRAWEEKRLNMFENKIQLYI
jgi:hypothetical protein